MENLLCRSNVDLIDETTELTHLCERLAAIQALRKGTQDVNLARRNHSHQHSYNTRSQPNRNSAMHTPEPSNVLNTE